eukprot:3515273-Ditylum_brightwellii.AAC.1
MSMKKQFLDMEREKFHTLSSCMADIKPNIESNEESLEKIKSNLNVITQTISKFKHKLVIQKEIYSTYRKDINSCISDIASHDKNNKVIHSWFEEKLNKAIHKTKQVATMLSEACNKAPTLKFHVQDSRIDNTDNTLHYHDKEIQNLMNKYSYLQSTEMPF